MAAAFDVRTAAIDAARQDLDNTNRGAAARMALVRIVRRGGYDVSLVEVHTWTREQQGKAYLWALAYLGGQEDVPAPEWVRGRP